jgi:hypothetical protein
MSSSNKNGIPLKRLSKKLSQFMGEFFICVISVYLRICGLS